jgi:hypothetical protein
MEWLRHFNKQTNSKRKGKYRMIIFDGHESHLTDEFTYYCWEHNIIPFRLPAHSTHLLQPLDIGVFQPFKHWHQVFLHTEVRYGALEFSKVDFLAAFQKIHNKTFKKKTILSAWAKAGLFPFNPAIVEEKMSVLEAGNSLTAPERPKTPPNPVHFPFQQTPTTQTYRTHLEYMHTRWLDSWAVDEPLTPSYFVAVRKYEKYSTKKILQAELMKERELKQAQSERERLRQKSGSNSHVQKNGVIYKGNAVSQIKERHQEVVNQALNRKVKKYDKIWAGIVKNWAKTAEEWYKIRLCQDVKWESRIVEEISHRKSI